MRRGARSKWKWNSWSALLPGPSTVLNGPQAAARTALQKFAFGRFGRRGLDLDDLAVGQLEGGDVPGVAEGMLGKLAGAVARAADIAGRLGDRGDTSLPNSALAVFVMTSAVNLRRGLRNLAVDHQTGADFDSGVSLRQLDGVVHPATGRLGGGLWPPRIRRRAFSAPRGRRSRAAGMPALLFGPPSSAAGSAASSPAPGGSATSGFCLVPSHWRGSGLPSGFGARATRALAA